MTPALPAAPCALCGTTGGNLHANTNRPARVRTDRYGLPGVCCYGHYVTVRYRASHGLDPRTGERLRTPPPTEPLT